MEAEYLDNITQIETVKKANPFMYIGLRWHHPFPGEELEQLSVGERVPNSYE